MRNKEKFHREVMAAIKSIAVHTGENEYRPCYVKDRKALFHRWINSASPALRVVLRYGDDSAVGNPVFDNQEKEITGAT